MSNNFVNVHQNETRTFKTVLRWAGALLISLGMAQGAWAEQVTTLSFDDLAAGTVLTIQYQSLGVTASGATVELADNLGIPANTSPNVAYAPLGTLIFSFDPNVLGNVQKVSAFVSGPANTGIFAYDANNNLVAQTITIDPAQNLLMSVTSTGASIARVEIHDGGDIVAADTLTIESAVTPPPPPELTCKDIASEMYNDMKVAPDSAFRLSRFAKSYRNALLKEIQSYQKMVASSKTTKKKLLSALSSLRKHVSYYMTASGAAPFLEMIDESILRTKEGTCG